MASRTFLASSRNLPIRVTRTAFEFAGITSRWIAPNTVGALTNPSYGTLDLRAQYIRRLHGGLTAELFVDIFNIADNQGAVRNQDLVAGLGNKGFGERDSVGDAAPGVPRRPASVLTRTREGAAGAPFSFRPAGRRLTGSREVRASTFSNMAVVSAELSWLVTARTGSVGG